MISFKKRKGNMEDSKDAKVDEVKSESFHHYNHGLKVVLVVLVCLLVIGGVAGIAKLAIGRHGFNQVTVEKNVSFGGGNVDGPRGGQMMGGRGMRGQVGTNMIGKISKIDGNNVTIHKDSNNKDYTIVISDTTQIRKDGEIAGKTDLANGLAITVQGNANSSGEISASIIIIN